MDKTSFQHAALGRSELTKLRTAERELEGYLVAYEAGPRYAELTLEQQSQLEKLERDWGVNLLAFEQPGASCEPQTGLKEVTPSLLARIEQLEEELCLHLLLFETAPQVAS